MNTILYAHGGSGNHGCEAIVRATINMLSCPNVSLFSVRPHEDLMYGIDELCTVHQKRNEILGKGFFSFIKGYMALKLFGKATYLNEYFWKQEAPTAKKGDVAFSIGGDNYCYSGAEKFMLHRQMVKESGAKTVLWGCSVEPELIDDKMREDLSQYDLITVRESISYEALRDINPNTVLAPDPAFTLEQRPGNYPVGLGTAPYIGINISPLIQKREHVENLALENYRTLIEYILSKTDRDIALVPHVVWTHDDDRLPLGQLYDEFKHTGRVYFVEDQNCMQLKNVISGCEFFVGARTHATIAAYSTCVPTLVVGYSVKARGIARDLFGTEEGYVLSVQKLENKNDLAERFETLYGRRKEIGEHLKRVMPEYIQGGEVAKKAVEKL